MDAQLIENMLKMQITEVRQRLEMVAGIARTAESSAGEGRLAKAIDILLDVEQPIYEVTTLLNAASMMLRTAKS